MLRLQLGLVLVLQEPPADARPLELQSTSKRRVLRKQRGVDVDVVAHARRHGLRERARRHRERRARECRAHRARVGGGDTRHSSECLFERMRRHCERGLAEHRRRSKGGLTKGRLAERCRDIARPGDGGEFDTGVARGTSVLQLRCLSVR